MENKERAIEVEFVMNNGQTCTVNVRRGKNRNIMVSAVSEEAAETLASLENPFSIFSPGLAGIAKSEHLVSDGVLLRTLARGDANLILRNILYRLWDTERWGPFLDDLHEVYPGIDLKVEFIPETDEFVEVRIGTNGDWVPLELAGTGILQVIQMLSYIHKFNPKLVVLDEPDSHLHPNNQRLLCTLLDRIANDRETQV